MQLNLVSMAHRTTFTDRQMDRQTDRQAGRQRRNLASTVIKMYL